MHQTADLFYGDTNIGTVGKIKRAKLAAIGGGDAFAFELCGDFLLEYQPKESQFEELPKYQATSLDVSVMVPFKTTVADLEKSIAAADKRIFAVSLKDIFTKDEWENEKSITMRFYVRDKSKTLKKDDIDAVYAAVKKAVKKQGAEIR